VVGYMSRMIEPDKHSPDPSPALLPPSLSLGLSHYLVDAGAGLAKALELAARGAANAPLTNFAAMHVVPRNAEQDRPAAY
jgi:hypothetical protein